MRISDWSSDVCASDLGKTVAKAGDDAATLRCPPKVRDDLTGPDVLGVRLGMTHDEALAIVPCALGEDAPVKTEERWFDRLDTNGIELGPQAFTVPQGETTPCDHHRHWQGGGLGRRPWTPEDEDLSAAQPGETGTRTDTGTV